MSTPVYQQSIDELKGQLNASEHGLSAKEAAQRLEQYGLNEISQGERKPLWQLFLSNFKDPMVIVLLIVAVVQIALGDIIESSVILGIVIISAIVTVIQERKAEDSLESLKNLSAPTATVLRNGTYQKIEAKDVVPGDIISLEVGDYIPADGRLLEAQTLQVEEGALTGESSLLQKKLPNSMKRCRLVIDRIWSSLAH